MEVRDYTSREIESRVALVGALKSAIIPELARIKVSCSFPRYKRVQADSIRTSKRGYVLA
jgi:hypothetical protein